MRAKSGFWGFVEDTGLFQTDIDIASSNRQAVPMSKRNAITEATNTNPTKTKGPTIGAGTVPSFGSVVSLPSLSVQGLRGTQKITKPNALAALKKIRLTSDQTKLNECTPGKRNDFPGSDGE